LFHPDRKNRGLHYTLWASTPTSPPFVQRAITTQDGAAPRVSARRSEEIELHSIERVGACLQAKGHTKCVRIVVARYRSQAAPESVDSAETRCKYVRVRSRSASCSSWSRQSPPNRALWCRIQLSVSKEAVPLFRAAQGPAVGRHRSHAHQ